MLRRVFLSSVAVLIGFAGAAHAGPVSDTLYYTTFNADLGTAGTSGAGDYRVWSVTGTYTGNGTTGSGTFTTSTPYGIANTGGSDGLVLNPNNGDLLVGGQGNAIYQVNPTTGSFTSAAPGMSVYELTVDPSKNVVWGGGSEGFDTHISSTPINPFSGSGTTTTVSGAVTEITHLTFVPHMAAGTAYYTSAADGGSPANFGTINLTTGVTTSILNNSSGPGAGLTWHGMDYDPFTGDLILAGGNELLQIDPTSNTIVSTLNLTSDGFTGNVLDQGAVDGEGHIFWADNNGNMLFIDYSTTRLIGSPNNFVSDNFLQGALDDFAPLIGVGGTGTTGVPEPASLLLLGAGLFGLGWMRRRTRRLAAV